MSESADDQALTPIGATREALDWLGAVDDTRLETWISSAAQLVRIIAPDCVAMGVPLLRQEITLTLASDRLGAAMLDAVQYLDGGPCEKAVHEADRQVTRGSPT